MAPYGAVALEWGDELATMPFTLRIFTSFRLSTQLFLHGFESNFGDCTTSLELETSGKFKMRTCLHRESNQRPLAFLPGAMDCSPTHWHMISVFKTYGIIAYE